MSPTSQSHAIGSFSQLAAFHGGQSNVGLMPSATEEIIKLKKEVIRYHLSTLL